MKKAIPLFVMLAVLVSPFIASIIFLDVQDELGNKARGQWLSQTHYVEALEDRSWQLLWRKQDCQDNCEKFQNLLLRVRMALGKHREKLAIHTLDDQVILQDQEGLFIANHNGLMLLQYSADDDGAYKLLKDLKVLMKHGGA